MRIACLQFAPQVGDVDNNLNRADSVLNRANPEDLDLLVLPELAFTGYNFKSLRQISPFLEPSGSGITSLWARTTALKYNCTVAVGYPEKVDVSANWPTSPEYYNSLLVINPDGETIANYRKTHLYYTDETWALEGHGFYRGFFPGLGHTTMGICMDLNPYRFEAPWHSFEFAFHILEMNANLVILSMAWNTREDAPMFTRMPKEPDMETLTYWIRRLEPLIRAEDDHEVIVVFCNRAGIEGDAVYAGTSTVLGIKKGEVNVYGILGRGDKDLLVVDTDNPAFAQLVYRPPAESEPQQDTNHHSDSGPPIESHDKNPKSSHGFGKSSPKEHSTSKSNSPKENGQPASRTERPRITIPDTQAPVGKDSVPTPSGPSPTPVGIRPKLEIPSNGTNPPAPSVLTPHPTTANPARERGHIYGGEVEVNDLFTPYTPFPSDHMSQSPRYFWVPPDNAAKNPGDVLDGHDSANPPTLEWRNSLTSAHSGSNLDYANGSNGNAHRKPTPVPQQSKTTQPSLPIQKEPPAWRSPSRNGESNSPPKHSQVGRHSVPPDRPTSPKSRNSSRSRVLERSNSSLAQRTDLAGVAQKLDSLALRSESAVGQRHRMPEESGYNPEGPKSRNASRSREMQSDNPAYDQRATNVSRSSILIAASPSILDSDIRRPVTIGYQGNEASRRRSSRAGRYGRHDSLPNSVPDQRLDSSMGTQSYERPPSRTTGRRQTPVPTDRTDSRAISRGRQPGSKLHPRERSSSAHSTRPEPPTSRENSRERRLLTRFDPNEIVAIEGHVTPGCPVHDGNNPPLLEHYIQSRPSASTSQNRSTSNNGRNRSNHGRNRSNQGRNYSAQGRNDSNQSRLPSTSRTRDSPGNQANHLRQESNHRPSPVSASVRNPGTPSRNPGGSLTRVKPIPDTSQTSNSAIANFIKSTSDNPTFRGISDEMLIASGDSPATPEQEPLTPKAMILIPDDDDDIISPMSAKTGGCGVNGKIKAFKCLDNDLGIGTNRPKSAVW